MTIALSLLFLLSGAAGLIYESIWARYLGLFVGHSAYAQIIVMVIFLGGMSAGAMAVGRHSARIANPLFAYAVAEFVVGAIGLAFHSLYLAVTGAAYATLFPALAGTAALTVAKWGVAGLLILPQSVLLGTTFPLMSAGVLRFERHRPGRMLALLYCVNSLGAALGVLASGFVLIGALGLPGTLTTAGTLNLIVAMGTLLVVVAARRAHPEAEGAATPAEALAVPIGDAGTTDDGLVRRLQAVALGTAVASFLYEVAWIRMLSLVLGSATHSFELMLSAFIVGLAAGSFWIRGRADRLADPLRALAVAQLVMGLLALATLPVYLSSFAWTVGLLHTFAPSDGGYIGFTLARYAICLAVMLPATFCAGIVLPLIMRILLERGGGERTIGAVYGWNTLGSIAGIIAAGLVLMPSIGLKWMVVCGAALDMELGALVLAGQRNRRLVAYGAGLAAAVVAIVAGRTADFSPRLLASGVYRHGFIPTTTEVLSQRDGRTASVSVIRDVVRGDVAVLTNGKPDASLEPEWFGSCDGQNRRVAIGRDPVTQTLLPLITLAHAPRVRTAAVIGVGSGMSSHFLLASPTLEKLVTIEIEPEMVKAARRFYPANRRVFDDPRSAFAIDDAKSYFAAANRRFDLILSEPSNPWVSGVSGLFTAEFYGRIRDYLADDGVFGQWLHLYEIRDGLVLSVLAAIHQNFPAYEVFLTSPADVLILAGKGPVLPAPDWSLFTKPPISDDLCAFIPFTPAALEATRLIDRAALAPLLDGYPGANSDFFPILDLGAEKMRFLHASAQGFQRLASDRFSLGAVTSSRRIGPTAETDSPAPSIPRLQALALGAALRGGTTETGSGDPSGTTLRGQKLFRLQLWTDALASGPPPADWTAWAQDALEIEQDLDGGTAGTAAEEFFAAAYAFMEAHGAPREARDALHFRHGLATWNFEESLDAAGRLIPLAVQNVHWVNPDELRAGAAVSYLLRQDPAGARATLDRLAPVSSIAPDDVRLRLLQAQIARMERLAGPRTAAR